MLLVATIVMSRPLALDVRDARRWVEDTLQPYPGFVCDPYKEWTTGNIRAVSQLA